MTALYFSQWSYPHHLPADIPLSRITNIYFAFADIDTKTYSISFCDDNCLKNKINFPFQVLKSDVTDLEFKNISDNVNSEFYDSIEWVEVYRSNFQEFSLVKSQISEGLIGQLQQLKKINPRLKMSLSIGGSDSLKSFRTVTTSKKKMKKFVSSIATYVEELGFDGVDIDWEFPRTSNDAILLNKLVKSLYFEFIGGKNSIKKLITLAIPLDTEVLKNYDFNQMDQYVNYYNLMGYDISGKWSSRSGFQSQLYTDPNVIGYTISVDNSLKYLSGFIDKAKIVLGMPAYGTTFDTNKLYDQFKGCAKICLNDSQEEENSGYFADCNIDYHLLPPPGYIEVSNTEVGASYAYSDDSIENKGLIVYDTPEVARLKARYVINNGLAGGFWWDSKGDTLLRNTSRSLVYNFIDELGGVYRLNGQYPVPLDSAAGPNIVFSNGSVSNEGHTIGTCRNYMIYYLFLFHSLMLFI
ncbi:hypothetical protein CANINC_004380 [Pichia inconspicua]|uniref:chitinase n=1 Tax=Pichia inconspicua TaxID=52247 RepID=A0A4T0WW98_9ASCO|nr:hypothetical protein CANINC_004380 [[Candida] inconspicua]